MTERLWRISQAWRGNPKTSWEVMHVIGVKVHEEMIGSQLMTAIQIPDNVCGCVCVSKLKLHSIIHCVIGYCVFS